MLDPSDVEIVDFLESVIGLTGAIKGQMAALSEIASRETADRQNLNEFLDEFLDELFEQTTQNLSRLKQEEENVGQNKVD